MGDLGAVEMRCLGQETGLNRCQPLLCRPQIPDHFRPPLRVSLVRASGCMRLGAGLRCVARVGSCLGMSTKPKTWRQPGVDPQKAKGLSHRPGFRQSWPWDLGQGAFSLSLSFLGREVIIPQL